MMPPFLFYYQSLSGNVIMVTDFVTQKSMIEQILHVIIHSDGRFFALPFCLAVQNSFVFQHVNNMSQELVSVKYISAPDWVG